MAKTPSGTPTPAPSTVPRSELDVESWDPELEFAAGIVYTTVVLVANAITVLTIAILVIAVLAIAVFVAFAIAALADKMRAISASRPGWNEICNSLVCLLACSKRNVRYWIIDCNLNGGKEQPTDMT